MESFSPGAIPVEKARGWELSVNGQIVQTDSEGHAVQQAELVNEKLGVRFTYGLDPRGWDANFIIERGGGGAVTVPYAIRPEDGELLVGLLLEDRPNMGGKVYCAIGGFVDFGESHDDAGSRELTEETGLQTKTIELAGVSVNANRAFFVTDHLDNKGLHFYGTGIPFEMLTPEVRAGEPEIWVPAEFGYEFGRPEEVTGFKKSGAVRFWPWKQAIRLTPDGIAITAIARLVAHLIK